MPVINANHKRDAQHPLLNDHTFSRMLPASKNKSLLKLCEKIKRRFLEMHRHANTGHVGAGLSCAEILTFVRFSWMRHGDELVLSKGHAASALYSTLAEAGDLDPLLLQTYCQDGTLLSAHPPPGTLSAIRFATGSLGHGLSLAAGVAMAIRFLNQGNTVFCIGSDGEMNEGSIWEAALFATHQKLFNLVWLIDRNGLQGFGRTEDVMALRPMGAKLSAFGFEVVEVDGHDFNSMDEAKKTWLKNTRDSRSRKPTAVICHTIKGRGMGKLEDTVDCHYLPLKPGDIRAVMRRSVFKKCHKNICAITQPQKRKENFA